MKGFSHRGLEIHIGFVDFDQSNAIAELQLRELIFRIGARGHCYLSRGNQGRLPIPEATARAIFHDWRLGGDGVTPEILNTHQICFATLAKVVARGQAAGWMRG